MQSTTTPPSACGSTPSPLGVPAPAPGDQVQSRLAGMVMFSPETSEIAKPSELTTSVKSYMSVLQCVENYVNIDITRVFNNVLLQQTQQVGRFNQEKSLFHEFSFRLIQLEKQQLRLATPNGTVTCF